MKFEQLTAILAIAFRHNKKIERMGKAAGIQCEFGGLYIDGILDSVLDILGVPKDTKQDATGRFIIKKGCKPFCRDWFHEQWYKVKKESQIDAFLRSVATSGYAIWEWQHAGECLVPLTVQIKMVSKDEMSQPHFVCGHCGQLITDSSEANLVWEPSSASPHSVLIICERPKCEKQYEKQYSMPLNAGWIYLRNNSKMKMKDAERQALELGEIGKPD